MIYICPQMTWLLISIFSKIQFPVLFFFSWHRALKRLNPPTGKHCINELMYIVLAPCSVEATLYNTSIV